MERRALLKAGVASVAGLAIGPVAAGASDIVTIEMITDRDSGFVGFDPVGLHIRPGQGVRWILRSGVHTATAYHPDNGELPRRIPEGAQPWDSGYLIQPGETFRHRFDSPGVYDYFCRPHQAAGMVGRVVVGEPPEDWFGPVSDGDPSSIPAAAVNLPDVEAIMREGRVAANRR